MPGLCLEASFRQMNADRRILICKMKCLQPLLHPEWSHLSFQDVPERCFVTFSFQRQTRPHQSWSRFSQDYFHVLDPFFFTSVNPSVKWESSGTAAQAESSFQRALAPGDKLGVWQHWQQECSASRGKAEVSA